MRRLFFVLLLCGVMIAPRLMAEEDASSISTLLNGGDTDGVDRAIEKIRTFLTENPEPGSNYLRNYWLKSLMDLGRFSAAAELAHKAILAAPAATPQVETLQRARVTALLKADKPQEALAAAKSLFNISTMDNTDRALLTVTECLNAAHPGDGTWASRFRDEQVAGAAAPTTQPSRLPTTRRSAILAAVKVDAKLYDPSIQQGDYVIFANPVREYVAKGNLLLLADRPKEARVYFQKVLNLADPEDRVAAYENIARCIKAEDGTIGRANAWIAALAEQH